MSNYLEVDTSDWAVDLKRMATDVAYRNALYRAEDPYLRFEDSLPGEAKKLLQHMKKFASEVDKEVFDLDIYPSDYAEVSELIQQGKISQSSAIELLKQRHGRLISLDTTFISAAQQLGLLIENNADELQTLVDEVFNQNSKPVQDYLAGKESASGAIMGMVMKLKKGLNPVKVKDAIAAKLSK